MVASVIGAQAAIGSQYVDRIVVRLFIMTLARRVEATPLPRHWHFSAMPSEWDIKDGGTKIRMSCVLSRSIPIIRFCQDSRGGVG